MKRGTGNNPSDALAKESILSIQLALNGLSFCVSRFGRPLWLAQQPVEEGSDPLAAWQAARNKEENLRYGFSRVRLIGNTDRCCLVPADLYREEMAERLMALNGFSACDSLRLAVDRSAERVILMHFPHAFDEAIREAFPEAAVAHLHPLRIGIQRAEKNASTDIHLDGSFAYIALTREGRLQYAETLPCAGEADLLFILGNLNEVFKGQKIKLIFSGLQAEIARRYGTDAGYRSELDLPVLPKTLPGIDIPLFANLIRGAYENY